jgi:hypothetical protein
MPKSRKKSRARPKKDGDQREWTTQEQKTYLQSMQPEYTTAIQTKTHRSWFVILLANYFERFPTQEVTEKETLLKGKDWGHRDKRKSEERVS